MNRLTLPSAALALGLLSAFTCGIASADNGQHNGQAISGTYAVKYDRVCIRGPYRAAPAPAFFKYSTPETASFGFVQGPTGMSYTDVSNLTTRSAETGSYLMTVNPVNNTVTISNGTYHTVPLTAYVTSPVAVADFGTFSGSGSYVPSGSNQSIVLDYQTIGQIGDGVNQIQTTNTKLHLETRDKGDNFFSLTGRGTIALQHNLIPNLYRDTHCTGIVTGTRISR